MNSPPDPTDGIRLDIELGMDSGKDKVEVVTTEAKRSEGIMAVYCWIYRRPRRLKGIQIYHKPLKTEAFDEKRLAAYLYRFSARTKQRV